LARKGLRNDIIGVFGTRVLWTILGILSGVILARKLGPFDRGILALVLLVPNTVVTFVKLGITQANVYFINREGFSSEKVASNSTVLAFVLGCGIATIIWLVRDGLLATVLRDVPAWALAICLARIPMRLLDDFLYGVLQAVGGFGIYNVRLLVSELLRFVAIVACLVVLGQGLFAAVLIHTLVNLFNIVWLVTTTRREIKFGFRLDRPLLSKQLEFGAKSWVQTLTAHMLLRTDVYLVSYFLGPAPTAFYALALHLTEMVLEIPQAIGLVLYPRLASLPKEQVHRLTAQTCRRTLLLTAVCAFGIVLVGPTIITLWYGQEYAPAGDPLPWAAIGAVGMSIYVILTRDFTSQGRQAVNIGAGIPALLSNVALNYFLIPALGIIGAAMATAISYMLACVILLIFYVPWSGISLRHILIPKAEDFRYFLEVSKHILERVPVVGRRASAHR
jgi:O-antigen/teichoic acid export membrane protein